MLSASRLPKARLAVLITHPVQYTKPVFEALQRREDLDLLVVFGCDHGLRPSLDPDFGVAFAWDSAPSEGFPHRFASRVPLDTLSSWPRALPIALRAAGLIRAHRPDAVLVFAYTPAFISLGTLLLRAGGQRLMLRAESTDRALPRSRRRGWARDLVLRWWYRLFRHVFPIGSDSDEHFARLGVPNDRRTPVHYAVDVAFFQRQLEHWQPQRQQLRQAAGIPDQAVVLLLSGKLTAVKNPALVCEALACLEPSERQRFWLLVLGDGVLRDPLAEAVERLLPGRSRFAGFVNQSDLGRWYCMADALVFPSRQGETWGLVVNEALQFGLALLVSDHAGSARDLVAGPEPPPAGSAVFPSGDAKALAACLRRLRPRPLHPQASPGTAAGLPHPEALARAVAAQTWTLRRGASAGRELA